MSGDPDQHRKSRSDLRKAIREAKRQYRAELEAQTYQIDSHHLRQGLNDITGYKMKQCKPQTHLFPLLPLQTTGRLFLGVNPRKATGPDGVPGRALRSCVGQLVEGVTDIFNLSLLQAKVPTCFKKTTIIPVLRKTHAVCLNDYRPIALTSTIMKCFERLVMVHINSSLPTCLDPLQKKGGEHSPHPIPIYINGTEVERVESFKFLRVMITDNLSWTFHIDAMVKKAQECLFFLRRLRKFGMSLRSLTNLYRCTIESILSGCIRYGYCSAQDSKKLQKVVCTAQTFTEADLPPMDSIYMARCCGKTANIIKDPSYP
eukprot:g34360.t1